MSENVCRQREMSERASERPRKRSPCGSARSPDTERTRFRSTARPRPREPHIQHNTQQKRKHKHLLVLKRQQLFMMEITDVTHERMPNDIKWFLLLWICSMYRINPFPQKGHKIKNKALQKYICSVFFKGFSPFSNSLYPGANHFRLQTIKCKIFHTVA